MRRLNRSAESPYNLYHHIRSFTHSTNSMASPSNSFQSAPADKKAADKKQRATRNPVTLLASHAVDAVLEKKARDIVLMDMRQVSGVADIFILCTGDSDLQIRAIVEGVRERIRENCDERPWHVEGTEHYQWVLLDYVDLVVHVFTPEKRGYYDLERLWGDAPTEEIEETSSSEEIAMLAAYKDEMAAEE